MLTADLGPPIDGSDEVCEVVLLSLKVKSKVLDESLIFSLGLEGVCSVVLRSLVPSGL